jgi:hypothetical protein
MMQSVHYVTSPRIEVVLVPDGDPNKQCATFDLFMILHLPDGCAPETICLADGLDRTQVVKQILAIYTTVGEHHAFQGNAPGSGQAS